MALNESPKDPVLKEIEEEDDSHLPPCLQKKNRYHSSSSDDDADKQQGNSDSDSGSGSDDEGDVDQDQAKGKKKRHDSKMSVSADEQNVDAGDSDGNTKDKGSRSRSQSPDVERRKRRRRKDSDRRRRSRSRDHHRRKKRSNRSRSREHHRSKDGEDHHHRRRRRHRRRSSSRERRGGDKRGRRHGSRERHHRDRSRSRERGHRRSRSRSGSPKGGPVKYGEKHSRPGPSFGRGGKPLTFKEKMRQQLLKSLEDGDTSGGLTNPDGRPMVSVANSGAALPQPSNKMPQPLMSTMVTSTPGLTAASLQIQQQAMENMLKLQKETTAKTGVEIPSYYTVGAINPVKYAEQVQKRKLLWSKTKEKETNSQWNTTSLSGDADDKSKEKFKKLMGIKQDASKEDEKELEEQQEMKQKDLFEKLDREYQFARMATHTHKGIGLGFGGASAYPQQQMMQPPTTQS